MSDESNLESQNYRKLRGFSRVAMWSRYWVSRAMRSIRRRELPPVDDQDGAVLRYDRSVGEFQFSVVHDGDACTSVPYILRSRKPSAWALVRSWILRRLLRHE